MPKAAPRPLLARLALLALLGAHLPVQATESGYAGRTQTGCGNAGCHGPASDAVTVRIDGPLRYTGEPTLLQISVDGEPAGESGGMNLGVSAGTLAVPEAETGVKLIGAEATHNTAGSKSRTWAVAWTPAQPVHGCVVRFDAAGVAGNGDRREHGDGWNTATVELEVGDGPDTGAPETPRFLEPAAGSVVISGTQFATPLPGTLVIGATTVTVAVEDDLGLRSVELVDEDFTGNATPLGAASYRDGNWSLQWDTQGITPGPHKLRAIATDCAGNQSEAQLDLFAI